MSHKAYEQSGGACRPAEDSPFPAEDCQAQCGMGQAAEGGAVAVESSVGGVFFGLGMAEAHGFHSASWHVRSSVVAV